jgi:alkaline phosphatase
MPDFDRLVGEALKFADSNGETLVIVTGDHETGGLTLLDGNLKTGYVDGHFSTDDHTGIIVPVFATAHIPWISAAYRRIRKCITS